MRQFASLGGGNHFLELQLDQEDRIWVMLHSGSRYLGVEVRDYYVTEGAKQAVDAKRYARVPHIRADKDIRLVMRGQGDLVKSPHELRPVISIKGR